MTHAERDDKRLRTVAAVLDSLGIPSVCRACGDPVKAGHTHCSECWAEIEHGRIRPGSVHFDCYGNAATRRPRS